MYVIDFQYIVSNDRIDAVLDRHRAHLQIHFDSGVFIASGPKVPRTGGVILAARVERERLDAILASDPFVVEGLVTYTVTEFKTTRVAAGLNLPALP